MATRNSNPKQRLPPPPPTLACGIFSVLCGYIGTEQQPHTTAMTELSTLRKDEIARRKRLGLPLDGLIDAKKLLAGGGGGGGGGKPPPRQMPTGGGGGQSRCVMLLVVSCVCGEKWMLRLDRARPSREIYHTNEQPQAADGMRAFVLARRECMGIFFTRGRRCGRKRTRTPGHQNEPRHASLRARACDFFFFFLAADPPSPPPPSKTGLRFWSNRGHELGVCVVKPPPTPPPLPHAE